MAGLSMSNARTCGTRAIIVESRVGIGFTRLIAEIPALKPNMEVLMRPLLRRCGGRAFADGTILHTGVYERVLWLLNCFSPLCSLWL